MSESGLFTPEGYHKIEFKKTPICEVCGKNKAEFFARQSTQNWKFICSNCNKTWSRYYIDISDFFASPAHTVDWLAHLSEKPYMNWRSFMDMIRRLRDATDSYGHTVGKPL